jgi:uracil-DNA glycosylase family protein
MPKRPRRSDALTLIPDKATLARVRAAARTCQACDLWKRGTQTVFGEGAAHAKLMLVGEQPGHEEDLSGQPFVGPAGRLLSRALEAAGINRATVYVTNVVKHFKWEPRGKRRLHQKPNSREIAACRPWWQAELKIIQPRCLVCLGATAARAVFEREVKVLRERGSIVETPWAERTLITIHPSSLLRLRDSHDKEREFARFVRKMALIVK